MLCGSKKSCQSLLLLTNMVENKLSSNALWLSLYLEPTTSFFLMFYMNVAASKCSFTEFFKKHRACIEFQHCPNKPSKFNYCQYIDSYKQVKHKPTKPASYQSNKTLCNPVSSRREVLIQVDS